MSRKTPSDFLKQIIGRPVVVKLNSGVDYRGRKNFILQLSCVSHYVLYKVIYRSSCQLPLGLLHSSKCQVEAFYFIFVEGVLACLDGYMNIALEQTEEYVNGQLKNKYGDAFIRGNNGNIIIYTLEMYKRFVFIWYSVDRTIVVFRKTNHYLLLP